MPTITNATLTLTETNSRVTVRVQYDATFTAIERQLTTLGLRYHSHVTVHGLDGSTLSSPLAGVEFEHRPIAVTAGTSDETIPEIVEEHTFGRPLLQEDPIGDPDELTCNIRIHSPLPPQFTEDVLTPQRVLSSS